MRREARAASKAAREAQRRVASVDAKLRLVEGAKADETSLGAKADAAALFELRMQQSAVGDAVAALVTRLDALPPTLR